MLLECQKFLYEKDMLEIIELWVRTRQKFFYTIYRQEKTEGIEENNLSKTNIGLIAIAFELENQSKTCRDTNIRMHANDTNSYEFAMY